uniref:Uncharacterized protein n=1 Tax=Anguilla anguilla TaxID=7936 RepID=A0A0E9U6C5_ANGAN
MMLLYRKEQCFLFKGLTWWLNVTLASCL